jgi:hypothetical protein
MTISDRDMGWKKVMRKIRARKADVLVGIQGTEAEEQHQDGGHTVAEIMSWHEFGIGQKRRSWLRDWFDEQARDLHKKYGQIIQRNLVTQAFSLEQGLDQFGTYAVGKLQKRWAAGIPPPNAPSTEARKGSSKPLIDTGQSRSSVTYKVETA